MAKRLTEKQKEDIIKSFNDGEEIDFLSQKFGCTKLTIIRNLKKKLGELRYKELMNNRSFLTKRIHSNEITENVYGFMAFMPLSVQKLFNVIG